MSMKHIENVAADYQILPKYQKKHQKDSLSGSAAAKTKRKGNKYSGNMQNKTKQNTKSQKVSPRTRTNFDSVQ